ncbi:MULTISPECIES: CDP-alcohol phosphatidyltransferase family protein [Acinetobacter]|jgi:Phosphatidylglycerophosphate synthase|uniref:CDP-alcohol phosphatidyltransferase family protein n=1 Tax=Acinetobacter TaxID=469 RepID=UPI0014447766|nr:MULTISPECIES: CDP-alcohol phosphatidyltransferase family protein [Acinetobacter]UUS58945.1 CDP-alcohol phosphatidyltransferase family protein [Acinetobacter sp. YH16040_T]UUS59588.1 CDP-alcohol phosphatidyltransferase family protein [Acinetobacter sp. YH16056_T]
MPSIYQLKPAFQNLLRPLVKSLHHLGITANQVTLLAMFISLAVAFFIYIYFSHNGIGILLLIFPVWMLIRMGFNAIDGMLAREFNQQSKLGAFYNELCDVISDSALYFSLICFAFIQAELLILTCFLAILAEYTGVMAPLVGQERRYDGPMGKSDRAFVFSIICVIIVTSSILNVGLNTLSLICNSILIITIFLLFITIYNRIKNSIINPQ